MPVYGKGRTRRRGKTAARLVHRERIMRDIDQKPFYDRGGWSIEKSRIGRVEKTLKVRIREDIAGRIARGERPVVLDWGCGTGRAIVNLAKTFPQIHAYGFSDLSYGHWKGTQSVKFIHDTKERLLRLVKDSSVDLIFSHSGISQIGDGKMQEYLLKLLPKLKKGGILATDHARCVSGPVELGSEFSIGGMKFTLERRNSQRSLVFRRVE